MMIPHGAFWAIIKKNREWRENEKYHEQKQQQITSNKHNHHLHHVYIPIMFLFVVAIWRSH